MKILNKKILYMLIPILAISLNISAQTNYKLTSVEKLEVAGTSSLHDWTMSTQTAEGQATIVVEDNVLKDISKLTVSMKAETLKSGKSGMDDNAYKALKTKKNPEITYTLKEVKNITKKGDHYLLDAVGVFSIAGEAKTVTIPTKAFITSTNIKFTGSKDFKMTDFKIDPPTALLGTIKTGDDITINFNLTFKK